MGQSVDLSGSYLQIQTLFGQLGTIIITSNKKSLWSVTQTSNDSWTWITLLNLRPLASQFIHGIVGNGLSLRFWFDHSYLMVLSSTSLETRDLGN